jgi:hypothetical protein
MTLVSSPSAADILPTIRYSPVRYRLLIGMGVVAALTLLAYGVARAGVVYTATGVGGLLLVGLCAYGVKDRLRTAGIALAREGDFLIGGELNQPLPVGETTFEIVSDYNGSWVIVLRHQERTVRLGAGGWKIDGVGFATRARAERALVALGLSRHTC